MMGKNSKASTHFNLKGAAVSDDPYPTLRRILEEAPVHWNASMRGWVLARYADVASALCDPRMSANRLTPYLKLLPEETQRRLLPTTTVASRWAILHDPPEHTRLRESTQKSFSPRMLEAMRPRVQTIADELLDALGSQGRMDLVADFAFPLPAMVIAELLGAPHEDRGLFTAWSPAIARLFSVSSFSDEFIDDVNRATTAAADYLHDLLGQRRRAPRHDLMSHLVAVKEQGAALSDDEIVAECVILLVAGHESTVNLISNGMLVLLQHPDQMQKLLEDPSLMPNAVEEILRYDGPSRWITRMALEDMVIGGERIEAGDPVVLLVSAANRDPAQFPYPDRFDIARANIRHLGFSAGIHYCEGAALGRLGAEIALATLIHRMPGLRLAVPANALSFREDFHVRALKSLPVAFRS